MDSLQEKIKKVIQLTGMSISEISIATRLPVHAMYKWKTGAIPRDRQHYNKLINYLDEVLNGTSPEDAGYTPVYQERRSITETLYLLLGRVDKVIEVSGDSMLPTFKHGTLICITSLPNPKVINWSELYYIVDKNGEGIVRRIYAGENENSIKLLSDNPDQITFAPIIREWDAIDAIYKVKAVIYKL